MTLLLSFLLFFFLSPTLAVLTLMAGLIESLESFLSLYYFFFLSFLVLSKGSESWLKMDMGALKALESSPQCIAPWV